MHVLWLAMMQRINLQIIRQVKVKPEEIIIATPIESEKDDRPTHKGATLSRSPTSDSTCSEEGSDGNKSPNEKVALFKAD